MTSCVVNNPSDVNATQHLIELMECVRKEAADFCDTRLSLAKLWIQGDGAMSACSAVVVAPQYAGACSACANTLGVNAVAACGDSMGGSPQESDATTTPAYTSTTTTTASTPTSTITTTTPNALTSFTKQNMVAGVQLCAGEQLGWYSKENGIKPVALRDFIANFSGWEDIPEELANVTDAIVNCEPKISEEGGVNTLLVRGTLWSACFYPKYFSTCGFKSNLTMMLFPGYHQQMEKEVEQFMSQIIDLGDDTLGHDQPQGHQDAEMVDAGLLEASPEKNEEVSEITDVDMERDVEAMTAENLHPPPLSAQMKGKEAHPSKDLHDKSVHTSTETSSQREKSTENPSENSSEKLAENSSEKPPEVSGASEVTTAEELTDSTMKEEETVGEDGGTETTTQTGV